jgi:hypothetical protein
MLVYRRVGDQPCLLTMSDSMHSSGLAKGRTPKEHFPNGDFYHGTMGMGFPWLPNSAGSNDSLSKIDQFETISDKWSHTINIQCNQESADPPLSGCYSHVEPT